MKREDLAQHLICTGCKKRPDQLQEYIFEAKRHRTTPAEFVLDNEGTLNVTNGHFACTPCYITMGEPVGRGNLRWVAP